MVLKDAEYYVDSYLSGRIDDAELVQGVEPLMRWVYLNHTISGVLEQEDFLQEARLLLLNSVQSFDKKYKVRFSTYYTKILKNFLCDELRKKHTQKQIPENLFVREDELVDVAAVHYGVASSSKGYYSENRLIIQENIEEYICSLSHFEKQILYQWLTLNEIEAEELIRPICQKNAYHRCRQKMLMYLQ
ncbi:RNA polymerase, sigma 30 subunit, SigH [Granulicatella balaenopterae]|uniref:RNA polymerase, sigma 30 subunit, SigH n=1 Tax=Granulicatella balaenopterae TaxID=137733 RepID=A0A1H9PF13_9LACT|nr:sigma-70 family RNA polymerase sigma factor [Granulicatella balaenopterae]SER46804.1 RNA polymerase, sigma 30 subunit, SigH [Granulicatella balaenopterae]